jgi:hypothetical protein
LDCSGAARTGGKRYRQQGTAGEQVADALGRILRRSSRSRLYGELTADLGPAVDEATYPVLSGLGRFGPLSAAGQAVAFAEALARFTLEGPLLAASHEEATACD